MVPVLREGDLRMTSGKYLTPEQREEIAKRMQKGEWPAVVARDMGISRRAVTNAAKGSK